MHGEQLVVDVGREHLAVWLEQLGSDGERLDATDDEEPEGGHPVHESDALVVDGEQPRPPPGGRNWSGEDPERTSRWRDVITPGSGDDHRGRLFDDRHCESFPLSQVRGPIARVGACVQSLGREKGKTGRRR